MPMAWNQIPEPQQNHGCDFVRGEFSGAGDGIGCVTHVVHVIEGKGLSAGNGSGGGQLVAVVEKHAGAHVKFSQWKKVIGCLSRAQVQSAFIAHAILVESVSIVEYVKSNAHVGAL